MAPAACAASHSWSSRTSISKPLRLAASRSRVSATVTSFMRLFASLTIFIKPSESFMVSYSKCPKYKLHRPLERDRDFGHWTWDFGLVSAPAIIMPAFQHAKVSDVCDGG